MHSSSFIHNTIGSAVILLFGLLALPVSAADKPSTKPAAPPAAVTGSGVAACAVEDSLQAFLARIPKDATTGQRMVAELSCRRDETDRKPFQATGGR